MTRMTYLLTVVFVCLLACLWTDYFLEEIYTRWFCPEPKDTPQEMLKDTLET